MHFANVLTILLSDSLLDMSFYFRDITWLAYAFNCSPAIPATWLSCQQIGSVSKVIDPGLDGSVSKVIDPGLDCCCVSNYTAV